MFWAWGGSFQCMPLYFICFHSPQCGWGCIEITMPVLRGDSSGVAFFVCCFWGHVCHCISFAFIRHSAGGVALRLRCLCVTWRLQWGCFFSWVAFGAPTIQHVVPALFRSMRDGSSMTASMLYDSQYLLLCVLYGRCLFLASHRFVTLRDEMRC